VPPGLAPNGFSFEGTDAAGLDYALNRALSMWYSDKEGWYYLASSVMQQDWSWDGPALDYLELYYKALKGGSN
jgi:starch synthase